jgi:plastocyanin
LSAIIIVVIPTNVVALVENSIRHSEDIVYVSASTSSNNTAKESSRESGKDSSAVVSLITISKGPQGNAGFNPQTTTIKTGGEILILNNDTMAHTIKNGMGAQ